jgi:LysM repeat protein
MGFDSTRRRSNQPNAHSADQHSARFGWQPCHDGNTVRITPDTNHRSLDGAAPASDNRPTALNDSPASGSPYWMPNHPGELPPTIIRRKKPPVTADLLGRYGKPAAVALTVAAVSSAGLGQPSPTASAQATNTVEPDGATGANIRHQQQIPPLFELLTNDDESSPTATGEREEPITYTVQPGDEVRKIAWSFGLQTMTLVWNNDLPDPDLIFPGQELLIPPVNGVLVEVQPGDTLNKLATAYGTSTTAIINYEPNGITDPDLIHPGQTLIIPGGVPLEPVISEPEASSDAQEEPVSESGAPTDTPEEAAPVEETDTGASATGDSVEIQAGDTLGSVAQRFGVTIDELAQANQISDIDLIHIGDVLYMPNGDGVEVVAEEDETAPVESDDGGADDAAETPEPEDDPEPASTPEPDPEPTATPAPDPTPEPESQQSTKPSDIPGLLEYYANQYGLDPNLVKAVAWVESNWNQSARNPSGATGVMQIMPGTATWIDNNLISRPIDIYNSAEDNIHAGTAYLDHMIETSGSVERGLASYVRGPGAVRRSGINENARNYIDAVMRVRDHLATHGEPPRR